jgi:hypothetical protein
MLAHAPGREPHLAACLRTAQEMLRQKIAQGDQARYGVLLLGTEKAENVRHVDGVHCLLPLDAPSVSAIRALQHLADEVAHPLLPPPKGAGGAGAGAGGAGALSSGFVQTYGQKPRLPVQHAISVCMDMFRQAAKQT